MTAPAARPGASPRPSAPSRTRYTLMQLGLLALIVIAVAVANARWERLAEIPAQSLVYGELMLRGVLQNPFSEPYATYWSDALRLMFESLQIAWIGTVIGALLSFPLAFLAASTVAPRWIVFPTRQFLNIVRAIPE